MRGIYVVSGYPDRPAFLDACRAVKKGGFEFIEIGIPFSEPVADGPVIAGAIHESLASGTTLDMVVEDLTTLKAEGSLPDKVYVMTYANIIYDAGMVEFCRMVDGIVDGVIIPDVPNRMHRFFADKGFSLPIIPFVTPESRDDDIVALKDSAADFVYFIGIRGITGGSVDLTAPDIASRVEAIRTATSRPVVMGFGIKTAHDARDALSVADGFVVGTAAVGLQKDTLAYAEFVASLITD